MGYADDVSAVGTGRAVVLMRGGGDLATGVALRLHRAGIAVVVSELAQPLAVRRAVSFCEAVYEGAWTVEDVTARRVDAIGEAIEVIRAGEIPVLVEPGVPNDPSLETVVLVDARLAKQPPETDRSAATLVIGLGPGFTAGVDCHAVVETQRGGTLGRVYWSGSALPDTATPEGDPRRVLRAPAAGRIVAHSEIGQHVVEGQLLAEIAGHRVVSPFSGVLRGLIRPGLTVPAGTKIGDIDPRGVQNLCFLASDKSLALGGGVLEAILSRPDVRSRVWHGLSV
jgi:xanthine dehydrogenase accessory factor